MALGDPELLQSDADGVTVRARPKRRLWWSLALVPLVAVVVVFALLARHEPEPVDLWEVCGSKVGEVTPDRPSWCDAHWAPEPGAVYWGLYYKAAYDIPFELLGTLSDPERIRRTAVHAQPNWHPNTMRTLEPGAADTQLDKALVHDLTQLYDEALDRQLDRDRRAVAAHRVDQHRTELLRMSPPALLLAFGLSAGLMLLQWLWLQFGPIAPVLVRVGRGGIHLGGTHVDPDEVLSVTVAGDELLLETLDELITSGPLVGAEQVVALLEPALDQLGVLEPTRDRADGLRSARRDVRERLQGLRSDRG